MPARKNRNYSDIDLIKKIILYGSFDEKIQKISSKDLNFYNRLCSISTFSLTVKEVRNEFKDLCNKTLQQDEKIVVSLKMQNDIPDFISEKHWDKTYCPECFDKLISGFSGTFEIYLFNKYCYVQYNKYRADILIMINDALMSFIEQHIEKLN